jgi:hypothetical protein
MAKVQPIQLTGASCSGWAEMREERTGGGHRERGTLQGLACAIGQLSRFSPANTEAVAQLHLFVIHCSITLLMFARLSTINSQHSNRMESEPTAGFSKALPCFQHRKRG